MKLHMSWWKRELINPEYGGKINKSYESKVNRFQESNEKFQ